MMSINSICRVVPTTLSASINTTDPNYSYTSCLEVLLHCDEIPLTDSSPHAHTVTTLNTLQNTTSYVFAPSALKLASNSTVNVPLSTSIGMKDFTIEFRWTMDALSTGTVLTFLNTSNNLAIAHSHALGTLTFTCTAAKKTFQYAYRKWNHIVMDRYNGVVTCYVNGELRFQFLDTTDFSTHNTLRLGSMSMTIDELRVTSGYSIYKGMTGFVLPTTPYTSTTLENQISKDPNSFTEPSLDDRVYTLLHCEGTDISDSGYYGVRVARSYGSAILTTAKYKFGSSCLYFKEAAIDVPLPYVLSSQDFTVDFWFQFSYTADYVTIFSLLDSASYPLKVRWDPFNKYFTATCGSSSANTTPIPDKAWHHLAVERSGNTVNIFQDGLFLFQLSCTQAFNTNMLRFGAGLTSETLEGYMDEIRVLSYACYQGTSFILPTTPY